MHGRLGIAKIRGLSANKTSKSSEIAAFTNADQCWQPLSLICPAGATISLSFPG
jgi:hypothetical protein